MAKFELPIYDEKTGEIAKTYKRDFMPTGLYIRFLKLSEKLVGSELKTDAELFELLKDLMCETFSEMTEDEYIVEHEIDEHGSDTCYHRRRCC